MNPYHFFIKALVEIYGSAEKREIKTPLDISQGEFVNFSYQLDAIKDSLECLEKYDGVIIADVVGLGKSVIATTIAYNLAMPRTVIITPPHLKQQWNRYVEKFHLHNVEVMSSGKIEELHSVTQKTKPTLYIVDEAHRYRNEDTTTYRLLHQIVRSQAENKVILLTATPYNNHPKDIYALIKLFQIPGRATLNVADDLGLRFGQLIAEYNQLERLDKRRLTPENEQKMSTLAEQMRLLIEPVVIRRSRIDLMKIKKYADDLAKQRISFAKVCDPELISYSLGELTELYYQTLAELNAGEFTGAKYKPLTYLKNEDEFNERYNKLFSFSRTQQLNMAKLARRLFVLRFESSQYAFRRTLETLIIAHKNTVKLWQEKELVEISKSKTLDGFNEANGESFTIPKVILKDDFIEDVKADLRWLEKIQQEWSAVEKKDDPKQERVEKTIRELLYENPKRKIVVFTSFADTAHYVTNVLRRRGYMRTLLYTSTSNQILKKTVMRNFDASLTKDEREDEYDIIVATDALSEGFNLHRAGVIINYDIPYNPTRVIQRIGRINRIDQQMFDELKIYNLFPTTIGERVVNIKEISNLKMLLMNQIIGNDMKVLTKNEDVESFFRNQYQEATTEEGVAWDNEYRNVYDEVKSDGELIDIVHKISNGIQVVRQATDRRTVGLALVRRGADIIFMRLDSNSNIDVLAPQEALRIIRAEKTEIGRRSKDVSSLEMFRNELAKPYELPKMFGNRGYALDVIEALCEVCAEKKYLRKLYDVVRKYDDLCESELKVIAKAELTDVKKAMRNIQAEIPEWYLDAIQEKAGRIEAVKPEVVFVEDFR